MRFTDLSNVKPASEGTRLPAGAYICGITRVQDNPSKEYLAIEYDIADGEYKNYFRELHTRTGYWIGNFIRSYKETALPFFKSFVVAIEESNPGFKFDGENEQGFKRQRVGLILGEEEYLGNDGKLKTRLYVASVRSLDDLYKDNFKVPEIKRLAGAQPTAELGSEIYPDDEVPF